MDQQDKGLTVGELTITIGIVIIAGLIWSNLAKKQPQKQSLRQSSVSSIFISQSIGPSPKGFHIKA